MNKYHTILALIASVFTLYSFSTNPPDGKTGAPGDSFCTECHTGQNQNLGGTISVEGFPASITPGETYLLKVINRDTIGNAVRGGFQMTILNQLNLKSGNMANPSASSVVANAGGRQYFEHNPAQTYPDSNVLEWTVQWTAPADAQAGTTISWYVAGNIANGNFQNTGDRITGANGSGSVVLSGLRDLTADPPSVYPNPGTEQVQILFPGGLQHDGEVLFYGMTGQLMSRSVMQHGTVTIAPYLPAGIYWLGVNTEKGTSYTRWIKL